VGTVSPGYRILVRRMAGGSVWAVAAMLAVAGGCVGARRPPLRTTPTFHAPLACLTIPPEFEDRLLYYNGFEGNGHGEVSEGVGVVRTVPVAAGGLSGRCGLSGAGAALRLRGEGLSPHRPLTVSFWWALADDARLETGFGLVHLGGRRGYISHFCRGRGTWCALERPAAVLQVYYIPGIKNVNGIYDRDLLGHLDLRRGVWHHTALVIRGASLVEVYTDGRRAWGVRVRGRRFRSEDRLNELVIGTRGKPKMILDEVLVVRRAAAAKEVADYYRAIQQLREAGHLALGPTGHQHGRIRTNTDEHGRQRMADGTRGA